MWLYGYVCMQQALCFDAHKSQKAEHMHELSCCCWCGKGQQNAGRGTFCEDAAHSAGRDLETLCIHRCCKEQMVDGR